TGADARCHFEAFGADPMTGNTRTSRGAGGGSFRVVSAGALGCAADVVAPGVGGAAVGVVGRLGRESANLGSRSLSGTFTESLAGRLQPGTGSGHGACSRTRTELGEVFEIGRAHV